MLLNIGLEFAEYPSMMRIVPAANMTVGQSTSTVATGSNIGEHPIFCRP